MSASRTIVTRFNILDLRVSLKFANFSSSDSYSLLRRMENRAAVQGPSRSKKKVGKLRIH